ncbi:MAG: exodeoxyribonuclease III [Bifidobacteriaceae bacterium]|jgi:exodeoxyribonuclease-3|nr:exodeoxyribonuclease III [Bifidobacteriaceae bacterium]
MSLEITSLNVGGIRSAARKGMGSWLRASSPDVLCLQEVRAPAEVLDPLLPGRRNHQAVSRLKGRSGVAVSSLLPVAAVREGLPGLPPLDTHTGRWLETDLLLPDSVRLTVVSAYVHAGEVGTERQEHKLAFLEAMTARLADLAGTGPGDGAGTGATASGNEERLVVVCGDFNVAHREADLKNWKGNLKNSGFLPDERAFLTRWFVELGWIDIGRQLAGEREGPYTWWSWRGKAFDNDTGWRIDYQIATPALAAKALDFRIDKAERYDARWTDHAPFTVTYALPGHTPA